MSGNVLRWLNETQVRRVLAQGGRLLSRGGQWRVWRSHDTRRSPAGAVPPLLACRLRASGVICPDLGQPGRFMAAPGMEVPSGPAVALPARYLAASEPVKPVSLYAGIISSLSATPGETTRLTAAARRFTDEVRQSAGYSARHSDGEAALDRLRQLERRLGPEAFGQLESLLLEEIPPSAFARRHGYPAGEEAEAALTALRALAAAYGLGGG